MNNHYTWDKNTFDVIKSYLKRDDGKHLVLHQIQSFNIFIERQLPEIIGSYNSMVLGFNYLEDLKIYQYEMTINFNNTSLQPALIHENDGSTKKMLPNDARKRNFTDSSLSSKILHFKQGQLN